MPVLSGVSQAAVAGMGRAADLDRGVLGRMEDGDLADVRRAEVPADAVHGHRALTDHVSVGSIELLGIR